MKTLTPTDRRWLDDHLDRWVRSGLVTEQQAAAIAHAEAGAPVPGSASVPEGGAAPLVEGRVRAGIPLAAELLSYLGIVLVVASGVFVVARFWDELHTGGRLAVAVVVAVLGMVAGFVVTRLSGRGARRLGGFLWLGGTAGVGLTAGLATFWLFSHDHGTIGLVVGAAVLAVSAFLWRNLDRPLQFLTTVAGFVAVVVSSVHLLDWRLSSTQVGLVTWVGGAALVLLGWRVAKPQTFVLIVGGMTAIGGSVALVPHHRAVGFVLGIVTAAAVLLAGLALKHVAVVVVGVLGFLVVLARILATYLRGPVSALVVLALGIAVVVGAVSVRAHGGGRPLLH